MTSIHLPGLAQLLFLFTFLNVIHSTTSERCSTDSNFTANSTFHSNLNLLLPSLISAAVPSGVANKSTGRSPDQVFGVALCRGDLFPDECQACLATVVDKLRSWCPYGKDAAFWLDCFLAYSNTNFSADSAKSSFVYILYNVGEVSEPQRYKELVGALMLSLIDWAAYKTGRLFAMAQANFTSSTRVYGLVQCTRDQSGDDCSRCLRASLSSMQSCCWRNQGGVVLKYRCYMRYETYEYYNMSLATAPLPPLPAALSPPPPTTTTSPPPPPAAEDSDSSPSIGTDAGKKQNSAIVVLLVVPVLCALVLVSVLSICFWRRGTFIWQSRQSNVGEEENQNTKALFFDLDTLKVATNNFSETNKLGEGGFGPVYKGVLSDGQEIAVKRLSSRSQQGFAELRNEVALVAKLQHRNLVRLIGCCLEEEKLLVYEFLPNTSLDKILFDSRKCEELNWERRYKIIEGIARGLLYLHEDSPQKVVHRDLKPGNILLDKYMKPKISDFGLSKLFDDDKSEVNASRIVGTNGYIAPEYACHRHFSTKSDVYSYGVLVLEIITGRRISAFRGSGNQANLQSYAWKYWSKGKALRIVDQRLGERYHQDDVLRCIHMALLCVQDDPSKRPSMASVILMLSSASMTNPSPSAPGFLVEGSSRTSDSNGSTRNDDPNAPENKNRGKCTSSSVNDVSITMEPR